MVAANQSVQALPRVVIVGGGFAGIYATKHLGRANVHVTLIDRKNHHTFQPLLYQVATAGLNPGEIAGPIRAIFRHNKNTEILLAEVTGFDLSNQQVLTEEGAVSFDYLIVAAGATHAYFGHDDWAEFAPGLKTVEDAIEIRRRVLLAFEIAEREGSLDGHHKPINFVIVGGGPTGVELAGALAEITRRVIKDDFRHIDPRRTRIILVEAGPRVLAAFPPDLSASAERQLKHLGVEVFTNALVTNVERESVTVGNEKIPSAVTLWGAGVAASPLGKLLGATTDRAGRVEVLPDLTIPNHPNVFVVGDLATLKTAKGLPVPGVAPAAIQMGTYAAKTIIGDLKREPRKPFAYWDKGTLATIGRNSAVGDLGIVHLTGFLAWAAWGLIHIYFLIGFRNRLRVMADWVWQYLTFRRGTRLITGESEWIVPPPALPPAESQQEAHRTGTLK
jgi:NADH:ubiquinone reductase (H+-translocating)